MTWQAIPWQSSLQAAFTTIWGSGVSPIPSLDLNFTLGSLDPRITYSGASLATLTNAAGAIAYKPHNLLLQSDALATSPWGGCGAADASNDFGGRKTWTLTKVAGTASESRNQTFSATPGRYTHRIYLWAGTSATVEVAFYGVTSAWANDGATKISGPGTLSGSAPANITGLSSTDPTVIEITKDVSASETVYLLIYPGAAASTTIGTSVLVQVQNVNVGPLQPYYPTTSAAYYGPRFTYDPVTHAALGLLIEEQRTNLLLNSLLNGGSSGSPGTAPTSWAFAFNGGTTTVSAGPLSGSSVTLAVGGAGRHNIAQSFVLTPSTKYTLSFNLTAVSGAAGDWVVLLNVPSGSISGTSFLTVSAGTGSKSMTFTAGAGGATINVRIGCGTNANSTGAMSVTFDSLQLEAGAFATSYIPTTSASVTRAADSATMTGSNFSSWFNATQGAFVVDAQFGVVGPPSDLILAHDGSTTNSVGIYMSSSKPNQAVNAGGVSQTVQASGSAWTLGATSKVAASFAGNDFRTSNNGAAVVTDSVGSMPSGLNSFSLGGSGAVLYAGTKLNAPIARLRYYNTALTNAQLQALTT